MMTTTDGGNAYHELCGQAVARLGEKGDYRGDTRT